MRLKILILALALCATSLAISADGDLPPVLELIANPERLTILAIDSSGERAVGSMPEEGKRGRSLIVFYSTAQPEAAGITVSAEVRALLLEPEVSTALAILHKSAKKSEGTAYLARVDPSAGKAKRLVRLPPSAVDLDYFPARQSLLVACRYEIRTLLLPDMRSGPLYRVSGGNRAVAALGRSSRILIGQDEKLVLVDLDASHGRDEMPVAGELPFPQPVNSISTDDDGSYALVTLADYSVRTVNVATLAPAEQSLPAPEPEEIRLEVVEQPPAEPEQPVVEEIIEQLEVVEQLPAEPEQPVVEEIIEQQAPEPEEIPLAIEEIVQKPETEPEPQVRGRIIGEHIPAVVAVLLLGPNNILNEAARVTPKSDGSWSASGLKPGRYRIQLDGGGRRVLVSEPSFLLLEIKEDGIAEAGDIRLLQAL